MRRADRLFRLVELLRGRRLCTGPWLAERLSVSLRTLYRDIRDLVRSGVPIEGEAGVGYRLGPTFHLSPMMLTISQAKALLACVRVAQPRLDSSLANHAEEALAKLMAVLPPEVRAGSETLALFSPFDPFGPDLRDRLRVLREACETRKILELAYHDGAGSLSSRRVWPLGLFFWESVWTMGAWCELREDFRNFRVDRIASLAVCDESFPDKPGRTLPDLFQMETARAGQRRSTDRPE